MDITLVLVTLLSLTLAAVMTTLAWRLAREERRRSAARVAALAAEIHNARGLSDHDPVHGFRAGIESHAYPSTSGVTQASGNNALRSALNDDWLLRDAAASRDARWAPVVPVTTPGDMFAAAPATQTRSRLTAVIATGVIVVGSVAALSVFLSGSRGDRAMSRSVGASSSVPSQPARGSGEPQHQVPPAQTGPLELVALTHEQEADRLIVHGVVRNPASGPEVSRLAAVVFVFNNDGHFVASARADLEQVPLAPGATAPFAVTIPDASAVGRYRVSFRTDERIVPHVDRRDRPMAQLK